jgi:hypothetical protein
MTDAVVRQARAAPGTRVDYFDAHPRDRQRGLVLRVSVSTADEGAALRIARSWAVLYRVKGSTKLRRATIGPYPMYGLGEARKLAEEIIKQARRGIDPPAEPLAQLTAKLSAQLTAKLGAMRAAEPAAAAKPGRKRAPETQQHVYVIGAKGGAVKIGIARDVEDRRRTLQTGSPHQLITAFSVPHARALQVEQLAHQLLADRRLSGEWFNADPERAVAAVWEAIARVDAGDGLVDPFA